jgi:hypothetical protein
MGTKPPGKSALFNVELPKLDSPSSRRASTALGRPGAGSVSEVGKPPSRQSPQEKLLAELGEALEAGAYARAHRALFSVLAPRRSDVPVHSGGIFERWWSSDGPDRPVALFSLTGDRDVVRFVLVAQRSSGGLLYELVWDAGGWRPAGKPKRWTAEVRGSERAYRCERDGAGYVMKVRDGASDSAHVTRTIGALLQERLPRPSSASVGEYRISLAPSWSWEARLEAWAVAFVEEALNGDVGE